MAKAKTKTPAPKARKVTASVVSSPVVRQVMQTSQPMVNSNYSFTSFLAFLNNNFSLILLVGIFFVLGFIIGSLWTEKQLGKTTALNPGTAVEQPTGPEGPTEDQLKKVPAVTKTDHIRGNANAKLVLVEYSDYECPFCNRFHPTMKQVLQEYGDKVAWVYRHYPLPFHPQAQRTAETSECVAENAGNDVFWKFSDTVYEEVSTKGADALSEANLKAIAIKSGANGDKVMECVKSGKMADIVKKDLDGGSAAGVNGTPGTIIITANGKYELIPGALPFEQVKAQLDALL